MGKSYRDQRAWEKKQRKPPMECPKCDGVHDHQLGWLKGEYCPKCGGTMVEVMVPHKGEPYGWGV